MTTVLAVALAVVAIAAAIAVIVLALKLGSARSAEKDALAAKDALNTALTAHMDQEKRLEGVTLGLKAEIASLEKDLDACLDPSVVRDRLRRMLAPPGGDQANALPPHPAAH